MSNPCPFDPELGKLLESAPAEFTATLTTQTLPAIAEAYSKPTQTVEDFIGKRAIQSTSYNVPGFQGREIGLTVFTRKARRKPVSRPPAFYYIHGGGMVMGHRLMNAEFLLPWVERFDGVFATVEYRVAPQNPDPIPIEDCYAGLVWLAGKSTEFQFDDKRIMLVGCSAGAGIAAGLALLARDRGGPDIAWQLLAGPMLDDRNITLSSRQYEDSGVWNAKSNQTGWRALLGERLGSSDVSIYAAPARAIETARGLGNLPPAYLEVGSAEVFRDEVVAYANGIWAKGGQADLHVWTGGFHGFDMWGFPRLTAEALAVRDGWVRRMVEWNHETGAFEVGEE